MHWQMAEPLRLLEIIPDILTDTVRRLYTDMVKWTTKQCNSLSHRILKMTAYATFFLLLAVSGKSLTRSIDTLVAC